MVKAIHKRKILEKNKKRKKSKIGRKYSLENDGEKRKDIIALDLFDLTSNSAFASKNDDLWFSDFSVFPLIFLILCAPILLEQAREN